MRIALARQDRRALLVGVVALAAIGLLLLAPDALARGNDVGQNLGDLLKKYAGEIYVGILAIISLTFLINRRYQELGLFLIAAVVVGWMVFAPGSVSNFARDTAKDIFG